MDINMVFMSDEFRGAEEEDTQMCISPKEVVLKKVDVTSMGSRSLGCLSTAVLPST
jgi:hypothetical protein